MKELDQDKHDIEQDAHKVAETLEDIVDRKENPEKEEEKAQQKAAVEKTLWDKIALVALIVSIIAWAVLLIPSLYSGYVALGAGIVSVVLAAFGLKSRRRLWRDVSTTAMIIGGVLAVVILSFIVVIYVGLKGM